MSKKVAYRVCSGCNKTKEVNAENFRRDANQKDGFQSQCKICAQKQGKLHYRNWRKRDVKIRGPIGVQCILWSKGCGVCPCPSQTELEDCWRLEDTERKSVYWPFPLREQD